MINYDDNGNLILSGKLGEAVVNNDFEAFTKAQISGKSEDGLTYQDMADFNEFASEFFRLGEFPGRGLCTEYLVLLRKADQAFYGFEMPSPECVLEPSGEDNERGFIWEFAPMQPFMIQGYEPAE